MEITTSKPEKRGFTLVELVVYFGLSAVVLLIVVSIFRIANQSQQATYSSYFVSGRTYSALTILRRDLQNTALSAITAYPNKTNSTEAPGMSCPSPFGFDGKEQGELQISSYGAPEWQKMIFYTVSKQGTKVGGLTRWGKKLKSDDFLPALGTVLPSNPEGDDGRGLLEDVLLPNKTVDGVGGEGGFQSGPGGGFEVQFVRRAGGEGGEESLSSENPRTQDAAGNTRLVQVTLKILRDEKSSRPSLYILKLRACPRY